MPMACTYRPHSVWIGHADRHGMLWSKYSWSGTVTRYGIAILRSAPAGPFSLLLLGFERLNLLVRQSLEEGRRVLGLPLGLVVDDKLENLLALAVVDPGIGLV